jgi:hypothetical protein
MEHYVLRTFGLDLAEIHGQADGNLVLIADSGEISGPMPYLGYP